MYPLFFTNMQSVVGSMPNAHVPQALSWPTRSTSLLLRQRTLFWCWLVFGKNHLVQLHPFSYSTETALHHQFKLSEIALHCRYNKPLCLMPKIIPCTSRWWEDVTEPLSDQLGVRLFKEFSQWYEIFNPKCGGQELDGDPSCQNSFRTT